MKKILLVIDMQNDFIDGALGTPEAVAVSCKFFLEKVAGIFGECCISVLEKVATPWSGRCHPMEADILC